MKTSVIVSAVLIGVSAFAFAADNRPLTESNSFNPGEFYGLIVNNNSNIILTQGEKNSVRIEGEKSVTKEIHTEIQNGALVINGGTVPANIYITCEDLNMIELNGTGKVLGRGTINSDILLLRLNGSGSMKVDIRTLKVAMIIKGDGKMIVTGSTGESFIKEFGKGKIFTDGLFAFSYTEDHYSAGGKADNNSNIKLQP